MVRLQPWRTWTSASIIAPRPSRFTRRSPTPAPVGRESGPYAVGASDSRRDEPLFALPASRPCPGRYDSIRQLAVTGPPNGLPGSGSITLPRLEIPRFLVDFESASADHGRRPGCRPSPRLARPAIRRVVSPPLRLWCITDRRNLDSPGCLAPTGSRAGCSNVWRGRGTAGQGACHGQRHS
jgi:hypothetical protein